MFIHCLYQTAWIHFFFLTKGVAWKSCQKEKVFISAKSSRIRPLHPDGHHRLMHTPAVIGLLYTMHFPVCSFLTIQFSPLTFLTNAMKSWILDLWQWHNKKIWKIRRPVWKWVPMSRFPCSRFFLQELQGWWVLRQSNENLHRHNEAFVGKWWLEKKNLGRLLHKQKKSSHLLALCIYLGKHVFRHNIYSIWTWMSFS